MSESKAVAVGHIPSGLFIVCAQNPVTKKMDGYLASWIQQISFHPLLISLCIKPGRPAYDLITSGNIFTINIIGDHERNYMKYFWQGYDPEKNPFQDLHYKISDRGGILIDQAKSVIECTLLQKLQPGDHELVIASVLESYVLHDKSKSVVHIRKTGLDY